MGGVEIGAFSSNETDMPRDFTVEGTNESARDDHDKWVQLFEEKDAVFKANEVRTWKFADAGKL